MSQTAGANGGSNQSDSRGKNKSTTIAIAAGVVGSVCLLTAIGILFAFCRRRRRQVVGEEEDEVDLISCFRTRRQSRTRDLGLLNPLRIGSRPGSSTVVTSVYDFRRRSMPEPRHIQGLITPYTGTSEAYDVYKEMGEGTGDTRLLQDQVRYLLTEVARLRLRQQLPRGTYTNDGTTSGTRSQPPDYATDVRRTPAPAAKGNPRRIEERIEVPAQPSSKRLRQ